MIPELFGEFEGDIVTIVVPLVQFPFELLIDACVLLTGIHEGGQFESDKCSHEGQSSGAKQPRERFEHSNYIRARTIS